MHERSVIADAKYQPASNGAGIKKLLKYYQYRDEKSEHIPQQDEQGRATREWVDCGLGSHHSEIMQQLEEEETVVFTGFKGRDCLPTSWSMKQCVTCGDKKITICRRCL